jgi:hypothetical protein
MKYYKDNNNIFYKFAPTILKVDSKDVEVTKFTTHGALEITQKEYENLGKSTKK